MGKVDSPRGASWPDCPSIVRKATQLSLMRSEDSCVAATLCILTEDLFTPVNPVPVAPHCNWGWDTLSYSVVSMTLAILTGEKRSHLALPLVWTPTLTLLGPLPESQFKPHLSSGSQIPATKTALLSLSWPSGLPLSSPPHPCSTPSLEYKLSQGRA